MEIAICCPYCGNRMGHSEDGSKSQIICQKCGTVFSHEVVGSKSTYVVLKKSTKKMNDRFLRYHDELAVIGTGKK